jgi:hypothetical protein
MEDTDYEGTQLVLLYDVENAKEAGIRLQALEIDIQISYQLDETVM